jgi:hypothetical protein
VKEEARLTRIGVKLREIRNLYVLELFAPGSARRVLERRVARRPWLAPARGDVVRAQRKSLRVTRVGARIEQHDDRIEHVTEIYTRALARPRKRRVEIATNVVRMPTGDNSVVAEFLRYHVLMRAFGGDADAWLAHLREGGGDIDDGGGDLRFVHWIRSRLRQDPFLLISIRRMVDATPFWRVAEA